jgi:hypothetical protein
MMKSPRHSALFPGAKFGRSPSSRIVAASRGRIAQRRTRAWSSGADVMMGGSSSGSENPGNFQRFSEKDP